MSLKKVAYKKEPKLHVHKYVLAVGRQVKKQWCVKYYYAVSLKEAKTMANSAPKGAIVEVYSAVHNFIQGYQKI